MLGGILAFLGKYSIKVALLLIQNEITNGI